MQWDDRQTTEDHFVQGHKSRSDTKMLKSVFLTVKQLQVVLFRLLAAVLRPINGFQHFRVCSWLMTLTKIQHMKRDQRWTLWSLHEVNWTICNRVRVIKQFQQFCIYKLWPLNLQHVMTEGPWRNISVFIWRKSDHFAWRTHRWTDITTHKPMSRA